MGDEELLTATAMTRVARLVPAVLAAIIMLVASSYGSDSIGSSSSFGKSFDEPVYRCSLLASFVAVLPVWADIFLDLYRSMSFSAGNNKNPSVGVGVGRNELSSVSRLLSSELFSNILLLTSVSVVNIIILGLLQSGTEGNEHTIIKLTPAVIFAQYGMILATTLLGMYDCISRSSNGGFHNTIRGVVKPKPIPHFMMTRICGVFQCYGPSSVVRFVVKGCSKVRVLSFVGTAVTVTIGFYSSLTNQSEGVRQRCFVAFLIISVGTQIWMLYKLVNWLRYYRAFFPETERNSNSKLWCFLIYSAVYVFILCGYTVYWAAKDFKTWEDITYSELSGVVWCETVLVLIVTILPPKIARGSNAADAVSSCQYRRPVVL